MSFFSISSRTLHNKTFKLCGIRISLVADKESRKFMRWFLSKSKIIGYDRQSSNKANTKTLITCHKLGEVHCMKAIKACLPFEISISKQLHSKVKKMSREQ